MDIKELRKVIRKVVRETLWKREGKGCNHKKKKWGKKNEGNVLDLECQECDKKFWVENRTTDTKCPRCGSHDLDFSGYGQNRVPTQPKKRSTWTSNWNSTWTVLPEKALNESLGNFLDRTLGRLDQAIISLYQEKHIDDKQFKMLQTYLKKVMKKLDVTLKKNSPRGWKGSHLREIAERIMQEKYTGNLGKEVAETVKNFEMCINELHRLKYITTDEWRHHFVHYPKWFDLVLKKWLKGKGLTGF